MNPEVQSLIQKLNLQPHPEGGFFRETYRSTGSEKLADPYHGTRNHSTCIYYLLTSDTYSAWHRIHQDEIWHFYQGSAILLHMILPNGKYSVTEIGHDLDRDQRPQFVVPGGVWFAAEVSEPNNYSLVGCTVAPGFDFQDFEIGERRTLVDAFPQHQNIIERLSRVS